MWWDHGRFKDLVACEKNRLLSSLLALAEKPAETSQIAFFLADNWVKYRYMGDIGESYDTITYSLNNAIDDVLGEYFTRDVSIAWRKVLAPDYVFSRTLNMRTSKHN
jgi:hemoglobin-like flavoprotein